MLEAIRPLVLLAVMGFGPVAVLAPLLHTEPVDAEAVEAAREDARREAERATRPSPRAMTASRRAELDAGTNEIQRREIGFADAASRDGRHEDAAIILRKLLAIVPRHHTARCRLLRELEAIGRWDGVEVVARGLLRDDGHAWEAHRALLAQRRQTLGEAGFAAELKQAKSASRKRLAQALAGHPDGAEVTDPAAGLELLGL